MLQCTHCTKAFKYESERKRHEQSHFPQFECQECLKKFSFQSALRRHQKQHTRTGSVLCNDCGRSFKDSSLLLRHIKYAHKGNFSCTKCDAKFSSESALSMHQKTHKPKSERRFHCSQEGCDKSFNFVHHLKHHQLTHTDTKQYHCDVCGKGFIQAHHHKAHLKTHEPENWLRCNVLNCKKSFATDYAYRRHLLTHSKVDSGISSDSSSDVHSYSAKDDVLCATCGQITSNASYGKHECTPSYPKEELAIYLKNVTDSDLNQIVLEKFSNNEELSDPKFELRNMESLYGGAQENEIGPPFQDKNTSKVIPESTRSVSGGCGCQQNKRKNVADTNCIEYRSDGTIKIKDTIDLDFIVEIVPKDVTKEKNELQNVVPFNSCKDILGKCIVSGNGTISEECLCAKMAMNDQEMIEQEIAEITPQPVHGCL